MVPWCGVLVVRCVHVCLSGVEQNMVPWCGVLVVRCVHVCVSGVVWCAGSEVCACVCVRCCVVCW